MTRNDPRPWITVAASLGCLLVLFSSGSILTTYRDNDFFQFWAGPHALLEGASPYDFAWSTAFHARYGSTALHQPSLPFGWTTGYPLWTFVLLVPLALLPLEVAAPLWLALQATAIAIGVALLAFVVLRSVRRRDGFLLAGIAAAFQPAWLALAGGNITGVLFGALVGAIAAAQSGRSHLAGALLGLLVVKPQAFVLVAIAFLVAGRDRRRLLEGGLAVVVPLVALSFAVRPAWLPDWLAVTAALQAAPVSNATLWTLDRAVPFGPALPALSVAVIVAAWLWWWRRRRPSFIGLVAATVPVSLLVAARGWSYDQLHLLVTIAAALEAIALAPSRLAWLVALAALAVAVPWTLYALAFSRGGEDLAVLTPLALFVLVVAADARLAASGPIVSPSSA